MATSGVTVKGSKAFHAMLKKLSSKTAQKRVMRSGVRAAAANTKKVLKGNVPVDQGDLKKSIIIVVRNKGYNFSAYVGADEGYSREDSRFANGKTPYFYDHLAEDGFERAGVSFAGHHYVAKTYAATASTNEQIMLGKCVSELEKEMAKAKGQK